MADFQVSSLNNWVPSWERSHIPHQQHFRVDDSPFRWDMRLFPGGSTLRIKLEIFGKLQWPENGHGNWQKLTIRPRDPLIPPKVFMVFGWYVLGVGPSYRTLKSQIAHKYEGFLIPKQFSTILNKGMKTTFWFFLSERWKQNLSQIHWMQDSGSQRLLNS